MNTGNRITPACAGISDWVELEKDLKGDHPRVCGDKIHTPKDVKQ